MHGGDARLSEPLLNIFDGAINGERRIHDSAAGGEPYETDQVCHGSAMVSAPDMISSNQGRALACWAVASLVAKISRLTSSSFTCRAQVPEDLLVLTARQQLVDLCEVNPGSDLGSEGSTR